MRIGLIGKYVALPDAYLSVAESLRHAGFHHEAKVEIDWIQAEDVEGLAAGRLADPRRMLVAGGFGVRGIEGKIEAAATRTKHGIPCLGLCLGLQLAIEFARNVLGLQAPTPAEFDPTPHPVIDVLTPSGISPTWAAPCASAPTHAVSAGNEGAGVRRAGGSTNGIATATSSTTRYRTQFEAAGCCAWADRRTSGLIEFVELARPPALRGHPGPPRVQEPSGPPPPLFRPGHGDLQRARDAIPTSSRSTARASPPLDRPVRGFRQIDERLIHQWGLWKLVACWTPKEPDRERLAGTLRSPVQWPSCRSVRCRPRADGRAGRPVRPCPTAPSRVPPACGRRR